MSFQLFPFGEKRTLPATFVNPGGEVVDVDLPRWGPGGRGLSRAAVTLPEGLEARGNVVSMTIDDDLGYVRILGGMDAETQEAFFEAVDGLFGVKGILLDCRGMNGGGDRTGVGHGRALLPEADAAEARPRARADGRLAVRRVRW